MMRHVRIFRSERNRRIPNDTILSKRKAQKAREQEIEAVLSAKTPVAQNP